MPSPEELLEKLPKKTPVWAIGTTTIVVALFTCLITLYVVAKEDISKSIVWAQTSYDKQIAADDTNDAKTIDSVLAIVSTNMNSIAEVHKALGVSQVQAAALAVRVSDLEAAVNRLKGSLSVCEESLKKCIDKK